VRYNFTSETNTELKNFPLNTQNDDEDSLANVNNIKQALHMTGATIGGGQDIHKIHTSVQTPKLFEGQ